MPILAWLKAYRWVEVLLTVVIAFVVLLWYRHSLIQQGVRQVIAADAVARETQARLDAQQEQQWRDQAAAAQKERDDVKTAYTAYMAAHPTGPVVLCRSSNPGHEPPQAAFPRPGTPGAGSEPAAVAPVPAGDTVAFDISAELELLVRSAAEVAADYGECQARLKSLTVLRQ